MFKGVIDTVTQCMATRAIVLKRMNISVIKSVDEAFPLGLKNTNTRQVLVKDFSAHILKLVLIKIT